MKRTAAVLLLCYASLLLALAAADQGDDYTTQEGTVCHAQGKTSNQHLQELNRNKNRSNSPGAAEIDNEVTLARMLAPPATAEGDDDRFDEKKGATIRGYVLDLYTAGKESCNCYAKDPVDQDTHIEIGLSKDAPRTQRVIVEITPRIRKRMKEKQPAEDWSTETLEPKLVGKWVEFSGWLMFDWFHRKQAENTNPGGAGNWRASCWEIHPVTALQVLGDSPGIPELAPAILSDFHAMRVRTMKKSPPFQEVIRKSNEQVMSRLSEEEQKEMQEESEAILRRPAKR